MTSSDGKRGLLGPGGRLADPDKRVKVSTNLSGNEQALIDQARGSIPKARYMRDAILEAVARDLGVPVGELDTARRAAPRSRNRKERTEERQS